MRVLLSRSDLDFLERLHLCPGGNEDLGRFEGDVNIAKHDVFKAVICSAPGDTSPPPWLYFPLTNLLNTFQEAKLADEVNRGTVCRHTDPCGGRRSMDIHSIKGKELSPGRKLIEALVSPGQQHPLHLWVIVF